MNVFGQLVKAVLEKLTTNPTGSDAVEGVIYYNTTSKEVKIHNGTTFKTVVDTDTAQALSNKEHDVAIMVQQSTPGVNPAAGKTKLYLKNDKRLFMLTETGVEKVVGDEQDVSTLNNQSSTPSTPAAGKVKLYSKSDKNLYKVNDAGLEKLVGSDQTVVDFTDQTVAPSAPSEGQSKIYVKENILKLMGSDGIEKTVGYRDSVNVSTLDVNWSLGDVFYKDISANTTFTFSNVANGRTITLVVTNTSGSGVFVAFPSGYIHTNIELTVNSLKTNTYTFVRANNKTYVSHISAMGV